MLRKIIKHDSRAILHKILPMFIVQLAAGVLILGTSLIADVLYEAHGYTAAYATLSGLQGMLWACIPVMLIIAVFTVIHQYHRSMFTDEGYLTMVIPVDTHRLFVGKLLSGFLWSLTAAVITAMSIALGMLPTLLHWITTDSFAWLWELFFTASPEVQVNGWVVFLTILQIIIGLVYQYLLIYTSITLSGCAFKKHKYLGAILFYFVVSTVAETLLSMLAFLLLAIGDLLWQEVISLLLNVLLSGAVTVGLYYLSVRVLRRDFNIE